MKQFQSFVFTLFITAVLSNASVAQAKCRLSVKIIEADTKNITSAMVCITNVRTSKVYVPPDGTIADEPTDPTIFFEGINFTTDKNWIGPLRKMSGKGAVNGQRTYVYGTSPSLPYWPEPVMYQTSGNFTIDLGMGEWRISIQHGNEYIPIREEITIAAKQHELTKTFLLKRWINLPERGWYSGDVHAHHPLNKQSFRDYILQLAKAEDVHLVNILQMGDRGHTYFPPAGFGKQFRIIKGNTCVASGQEEPRSDYGHIIGLNTDALARDTAHYNQYDLVFNKIHQKTDALVGYAHFAYGGEGIKAGLAIYAPTGAINFVELLQNTQLNTTDYYNYLNLGFRLAAAAGSDFPWGSTIGDGRTFVYTGNPFSADKWFAGLKSGHTFVSNGPALFLDVDGKLPGSEIARHPEAVIRVRVKAISDPHIGMITNVQVYNNDGLLFEKINTTGADSLEIDMHHQLLKSQWLTAVVYCTNGSLAHTSPVYVVVDGKPVSDAVKGPLVIKDLRLTLNKAREVENAKQPVDDGILERIDQAKNYYDHLDTEMKKRRE